jgi:hypothetical protein
MGLSFRLLILLLQERQRLEEELQLEQKAQVEKAQVGAEDHQVLTEAA